MTTRARLDSLEIRNYLGAGDEPVTLEFNGEHAVLCGPNGSGKTTVLSALDRVRRISWSTVLHSHGGPNSQEQAPWPITIKEWIDGDRVVTADLFHGRSQTLQVKAAFSAPNDLNVD